MALSERDRRVPVGQPLPNDPAQRCFRAPCRLLPTLCVTTLRSSSDHCSQQGNRFPLETIRLDVEPEPRPFRSLRSLARCALWEAQFRRRQRCHTDRAELSQSVLERRRSRRLWGFRVARSEHLRFIVSNNRGRQLYLCSFGNMFVGQSLDQRLHGFYPPVAFLYGAASLQYKGGPCRWACRLLVMRKSPICPRLCPAGRFRGVENGNPEALEFVRHYSFASHDGSGPVACHRFTTEPPLTPVGLDFHAWTVFVAHAGMNEKPARFTAERALLALAGVALKLNGRPWPPSENGRKFDSLGLCGFRRMGVRSRGLNERRA